MLRWIFIIFALALVVFIPALAFESALYSRVVTVGGICLVLWLSETVPPFVPTLLLWTLVPLLLAPINAKFNFTNVLTWAIDPVLALFLGGFAIGVATEKYGLDKRLARMSLDASGASFPKFLLLAILLTAFLSMWMSNIAAAALMLACLRPVIANFETGDILRRTLLVGIALGANIGGISTPVGTGPNAIAIASISGAQRVSFLEWMFFAVPLAAGMMIIGYLILLFRTRRQSNNGFSEKIILSADAEKKTFGAGEILFLVVIAVTIFLWLSEPWHQVPASIVALGATAVLFLTGLLGQEDWLRIDWSTLLLIAGGITLGRLLEQSEIVKALAENISWQQLSPALGLFILCLASAILSALMSNTATVVLLIPLANILFPAPSTAILIAVSASFGMPFVISTPPNAMVYGEGGVKFKDLFVPGIILMILGCLLVSLTGRFILNWVGIP